MRDQHDVGAESPESSKNASCSSLPRYSLRLQLRRHEFFLRTQTSTILSQSQVITTLLPAPLYNAQYRNQAWPDLLEPPMGASKTTPALPLRVQGLLTSSGSTESLASWHDMLSDHTVPSAWEPTGCLLRSSFLPMTINTSTHPYSSELSPGLLGLPRASSHSSLSFKASLPSELPYEYVLCRFELCEFKIARAKIITEVSPSGSPLRQDANLPNTHSASGQQTFRVLCL